MFILFYLKLYKYVFWNKRDEKDVRFVVFYLKYYFVICINMEVRYVYRIILVVILFVDLFINIYF